MKRIVMAGWLLMGMSVCATGAFAQTTVNTNGTSGNWSNPTVWRGGVVPNNGGGKTYDVNILNTPSPVDVTLDENIALVSLSIRSKSFLITNSGTTLTTATLDNSGVCDAFGALSVSGTVTNNNELDVQGPATFNALMNNGVLSIYGSLTLTGGGPGITDVPANTDVDLVGTFNVMNGGVASSGLA